MAEDLINKVFSFISGSGDEAEQGKQLVIKQFIKELAQNKYAKFYRVKTEELDSAFALYFYTIYRIVYPAQVFLKDGSKAAKLKRLTLEAFMGPTLAEVVHGLSKDAIEQKEQESSPEEIAEQLKAGLDALRTAFAGSWQATADKCYNLITVFSRFVLFDYYSMLQKFAPDIQEGNFNVAPKFAQVKAEDLTQEIDDFLSIINAMDIKDDWKDVLLILKSCKGGDLIRSDQWQNLLINFNDLKHSKVLELIVRLSTKNLVWEAAPLAFDEHLTMHWLEQKSAQINGIIDQITEKQRSDLKEKLEKEVFEDMDTIRLNYYTPEMAQVYKEKNVTSFIYAEALNHLLAFIQFFLTKEIQELSELLLIRGQWTAGEASRQMSEAFHEVIELPSDIVELDENLAPEGTNGSRLKGAMLRIERDTTQGRYVNVIIGHINEEALAIINDAVESMQVVGDHMRSLLEDYGKTPHHELIMNWKELNSFSKSQIGQRLEIVSQKIDSFIQLLQLETGSSPGE